MENLDVAIGIVAAGGLALLAKAAGAVARSFRKPPAPPPLSVSSGVFVADADLAPVAAPSCPPMRTDPTAAAVVTPRRVPR